MTLPDIAPRPWPEIDARTPGSAIEIAPAGGLYAACKVALDYVVTTALLVPALPVIGLCWLVVRLTSPGPGFYTQTRLGLGGRPYKIIKLRSMYHNCELHSGITWAAKRDARVFRFGRFLRATHLDELPQLFNVLLGHMSIVGPRPERPEVIRAKGLERLVPGYRERLHVRPGVTGLAQVQLPPDLDVASVRHKVVYDLYYVQHRDFWLDVRILLATVLKAAGVRPARIRRLFFLPKRDSIAKVFQDRLALPDGDVAEGATIFRVA
ncbi:MAG TPA: sugar transferase [Fimbriiglobus sp.]|jgi:lipopolysaccharide/colanic/teichoic acid biosynthesis glycosyltransferase